jgi:hypothetical protein
VQQIPVAVESPFVDNRGMTHPKGIGGGGRGRDDGDPMGPDRVAAVGSGIAGPAAGSAAVPAGGTPGAGDAAGVAGVDATGHGTATEQVAPVAGAMSSLDAIADALASGAIDPATARSQLVDAALAAQLPPGTDPALFAELRAEVEAMLFADPVLARLLTP